MVESNNYSIVFSIVLRLIHANTALVRARVSWMPFGDVCELRIGVASGSAWQWELYTLNQQLQILRLRFPIQCILLCCLPKASEPSLTRTHARQRCKHVSRYLSHVNLSLHTSYQKIISYTTLSPSLKKTDICWGKTVSSVCMCTCVSWERSKEQERETFVSPGVFSDASSGILSVTAQVIEAKSASLYLLCRIIIHRAAEAAAPSISTCFLTLRSFNNSLIDLSSCHIFHSLWSADVSETLCFPLHTMGCIDRALSWRWGDKDCSILWSASLPGSHPMRVFVCARAVWGGIEFVFLWVCAFVSVQPICVCVSVCR